MLEFTFLGQAGFLIQTEQSRFLVDPYLSNYVVTSGIGDPELFARSFPPPFNVEELTEIDGIFVTHDHADHCDPDTILPILNKNPECLVIGPRPAIDHLSNVGIDEKNLRMDSVFVQKTLIDVAYTAMPSAHYELDQDPITGEFPNLGYVFTIAGKVFYHSGDTILYDGMVERLLEISNRYDVCMLPVNGRDSKREAMGMIGNLHPEEALQLAELLTTDWLIPTHNDLFAINSLDPKRLDEYARQFFPAQKIKWMRPGEQFQIK